MVKEVVLQALEQSRGQLISGSGLAQSLHVSRAAVWKAVEALRADGMHIQSLPGEGYLLAADDDSLTREGISALLETDCFGRDLLVLRETTSTSTVMKQQYAASHDQGFTLIACKQTAGRGRLGRSFASPPGSGLYMSVLLRPNLAIERLNLLTITTALAVCRAIEALCGIYPGIKWVNDVMMNGKKLCGILTEASIEGETGTIDFVVLGIGVNVRLDRALLPPEAAQVAGALNDFCNQPPRRAALAAAILRELETLYIEFCANDTSSILDGYRKRLCCIGRPIQVMSPSGSYPAVCRGINEQGHLLITREDGGQQTLSSGEISIRLTHQKGEPL